MKTFIYTLSDKTGIRYVGKSNNPYERLKIHIRGSKKKRTKKETWISSLLLKNEKPILEILDEISNDNWEIFEKYWIDQLKTWGFSLVNGTEGGEGSNGFKGKHHKPETKEKIRTYALNRKDKWYSQPGEKNGRSKLTKQQVDNIKNLAEFISRSNLAKQFNVSKTTITWILQGKRWNK